MQNQNEMSSKLMDMARRIWELREVEGLTPEQMAEKTNVSLQEYLDLEAGNSDFPFTFIFKCAHIFGVEITDILEGNSANLTSYSITRRGLGQVTVEEGNIKIVNLAPMFKGKLAEPNWVCYRYSAEEQSRPILLTTHSGQEFDYILKGRLKVQIGDNFEILSEGDSIYYNSSEPHGMIAVGGEDCFFCATVMAGEAEAAAAKTTGLIYAPKQRQDAIWKNFIEVEEDEVGYLTNITFKDPDNFNFAFDIVDGLAKKDPDRLAMLHVADDGTECRFTFGDMSRYSNKAANYFKSLGIERGDKVMLVLKRHYQFWFCLLGLHKLGAVIVPATNQLLQHDFEYRFQAADIKAIICTADGDTLHQAELAMENYPKKMRKIIVNGQHEGWKNFDDMIELFGDEYARPDDYPRGDDLAAMFFTSGTTGYPKLAMHTHKYPLAHFVTAKYWHCVNPDGLHFTIAETGWAKSLWGKLYGQWLCEAAVFTYDFDRFDAHKILPMFKQHNITTFCAPPTMYRFFIKEDLSKYDLSSIQHATTAGEALNPEVFHRFKAATGLSIREAFGQTELTVVIGNFVGMEPKLGSMGIANPLYDVDLLDPDGRPVKTGQTGEIVIRAETLGTIAGLFTGYYNGPELTAQVWHDGYYHTGDTAWRDEDGFFWYVGRVDDVIKSSGYRIGPFEIESIIMELPYVLECGVSGAPDEVRGQVVKASIVLTKGAIGTDELKREIQEYVKNHTAPYKYPRIVVFRDSLPKTISGKIQRSKL